MMDPLSGKPWNLGREASRAHSKSNCTSLAHVSFVQTLDIKLMTPALLFSFRKVFNFVFLDKSLKLLLLERGSILFYFILMKFLNI